MNAAPTQTTTALGGRGINTPGAKIIVDDEANIIYEIHVPLDYEFIRVKRKGVAVDEFRTHLTVEEYIKEIAMKYSDTWQIILACTTEAMRHDIEKEGGYYLLRVVKDDDEDETIRVEFAGVLDGNEVERGDAAW